MYPKYHFYLAIPLFIITTLISGLNNALWVFFGAFFIDFDHYLRYIFIKKDFSLRNAYNYFVKRHSYDDLMIFHTIEAWILVFAVGILFTPFLYMLAGMLYHETFDIYDMYKRNLFKARAISIFAWATRNL